MLVDPGARAACARETGKARWVCGAETGLQLFERMVADSVGRGRGCTWTLSVRYEAWVRRGVVQGVGPVWEGCRVEGWLCEGL